MNSITIDAQIDQVKTMADGTLRILLGTQELVPDLMAGIFALKCQGSIKVTLEAIPNLN